MVAEILAILGSGPVGALIGGGLALLNRKHDIEAKRVDAELESKRWVHQAAMRAADLEQVKAEATGRREVAVIEGDAASEAARMEAIARTQAADRVTADQMKAAGKFGRSLLTLGLFMQTIVRPVLTTALVGVALLLSIELLYALRRSGWDTLPLPDRKDLALQSLAWVFAQASACVQYWMVSRGTGKGAA